MQKITRKLFVLLVALAVLVPFVLCGCEEETEDLSTVYSLSQTSLTLEAGSKSSLIVVNNSSKEYSKTEIWSSTDTSVATVQDGFVEAVGAGNCAIRVNLYFDDKNSSIISLECNVTVTVSTVDVTGISLSVSDISMDVGQSSYILASVTPDDATDSSVRWESSDPYVASVSGGVVTAIGAGNATITATTNDGSFSAGCFVTVIQPVNEITSFTSDKKSMWLRVGKSSTNFVVKYEPSSALPTIIWSSSNEGVAVVDQSGKITAVGEGFATVSAIIHDNVSDHIVSCDVEVRAADYDQNSSSKGSSGSSSTDKTDKKTQTVKATAASFSNVTEKKIEIRSTDDPSAWVINVNVTPANTTETGKWTCESDLGSVTIDQNGKISVDFSKISGTDKTLDTGVITYTIGNVKTQAVVIVYAEENEPSPEKTDEPEAEDTTKVTGITISDTTATVMIGEAINLSVNVLPETATNKTVTWSSSDNEIAVVENGMVVGRNSGKVKISASTEDGSYVANCEVTVIEDEDLDIAKVEINKTEVELNQEESDDLAFSLFNKNEIDITKVVSGKITWVSSNPAVVSVSSSGKILALAGGSAVITLKIDDKDYASCKVTVVGKTVPVTGIALDNTSVTINAGELITLSATVTPAGYTDKISWTSSNTAVATVTAAGAVKGVAAGTAVISVASDSGVVASCEVIVKAVQPQAPSKVNVSVNVSGLTPGALVTSSSLKATISFSGSNIDTSGFLYSLESTDPSIVDVVRTQDAYTNEFVLNIKGSGTVQLTPFVMDRNATINNYQFSFTPFTMTSVLPNSSISTPITSLSIGLTSSSVYEGEKLKAYIATVTPTNNNDKVFYYTSDATVATVDMTTGEITAIKAGTCTITGQAQGKYTSNVISSATLTVKGKGSVETYGSDTGIVKVLRGTTYTIPNPWGASGTVVWQSTPSTTDIVSGAPILYSQGLDGSYTITVPADLAINGSTTATGYPATLVCYNVANSQRITYYLFVNGTYSPSSTSIIKKEATVMVTTRGSLASLGLPYSGSGYEIEFVSGTATIDEIAGVGATSYKATALPTGTTRTTNAYNVYEVSGGQKTKVAEYYITVETNVYSFSLNYTSGLVSISSISGLYNGTIKNVTTSDENIIKTNNEYVNNNGRQYFEWYMRPIGNKNQAATVTVEFTDGVIQEIIVTLK